MQMAADPLVCRGKNPLQDTARTCSATHDHALTYALIRAYALFEQQHASTAESITAGTPPNDVRHMNSCSYNLAKNR